MNYLPPPAVSRFPPIPTSSPLAASFVWLIKGVCDALGERTARRFVPHLLGLLVWTRLRRVAIRFETLLARHRAGTLRPPRQRPRRTPPAPTPVAEPDSPPPPPRHPWGTLRPPQRFGWLIRDVPEAAVYLGYLERWLAEPEVAELLAAAPHAARYLRPLCRMLGMRPDPAVVPKLPRRRPPPPDPEVVRERHAARLARRDAARAERRWAEAYRVSLGLPRRRILA